MGFHGDSKLRDGLLQLDVGVQGVGELRLFFIFDLSMEQTMEGRADLRFAQAGGQGAVEQEEFRVIFRPGEIPWGLLPEELQVLVVDVEVFVELGGVLYPQELILFPGGELFEGVSDCLLYTSPSPRD